MNMKKYLLLIVLFATSLVMFSQGDITAVNAKTYDKEISKGLVLVDYWAVWCGPCRKMEPILKDIAADKKVKVVKLNVDENKAFVRTKGISTIPTMIIYKDGKEVKRLVGVYSKPDLLDVLNQYK